jgi:hypothetical protein
VGRIGYLEGMTFTNGVRVAGLVVVCLLGLGSGGCKVINQGRQARVTLTFENVRTFTDAGGRRYDEWASVKDIPPEYHIKDNLFGEPYKETSAVRPTTVPGLELRDYTITMVVNGLGQLGAMDRDIANLSDEPFGPHGERPQIAVTRVAVPYRMAFVSSSVEITVRGQATPGSRVVLYDQTGKEVEVPVGKEGSWTSKVGVGSGRYIYGKAMLPDSPKTPRCFRIDVLTRKQQDLEALEFEGLRAKEP